VPVLYGATIAASCDFALPAGTAPNAIVAGSGLVSLRLMFLVGIGLDLVAALLAAGWSAWIVPFFHP
jgi:sodium-dependent dicarboxylate transporter 2/3/5